MWVAWKRSRGILLGKFSRHQRFRLGSLQAVAAKCIQISWHSPHSSGSKWILCSKNSKLNFWVSGSPYIFGSDVLGHKSSCRKVLQMHTFATDLHVTEYQCLHVTFLGPWIQFCLDNFSLFASPAASLSGAGVLCRRIMVVLLFFFQKLGMALYWKFPHLSHQPLSHEGTAAKIQKYSFTHDIKAWVKRTPCKYDTYMTWPYFQIAAFLGCICRSLWNRTNHVGSTYSV